MDRPSGAKPSGSDGRLQESAVLHRVYGHRITVVVIFACSIIFLGGIWFSGIDLDKRIQSPEMFDPNHGDCLRTVWVDVDGNNENRARLCTEWIDRSDMSGKTHALEVEDVELVQGADGQIHTHLKRGINYRLVTLTVYLLLIVAGGRWVQRYLIERHIRQLGLTP